MKRGKPLERRTPLQARVTLGNNGAGLKRGATRMPRTKRVKPVSDKRALEAVARREFVQVVLAEVPRCEMRVVCQGAPSVDVDEIKARSAGGSFLDRANVQALCRACHTWKHEHPAEAHRLGFTKFSWE